MMEQIVEPKELTLSNPMTDKPDKNPQHLRLYIGITVFLVICIVLSIGLIFGRLMINKHSNVPSLANPVTDPLAMTNPTDGLTEFLKQTLHKQFFEDQSVKVVGLNEKTFQYRWELGSVQYTGRIFTQEPVTATNSGSTKTGMILVAIRIESDELMSTELVKKLVAYYFDIPSDILASSNWMSYDKSSEGVGDVIAIKWDNKDGSREWRGLIMNPPEQSGPVYTYSLQACRFFPGTFNFTNYECVLRNK